MSKTVTNWFARTGCKSLTKESALLKCSTVHPTAQQFKENVPLGNANSDGVSDEISNGDDLKAFLKPEIVSGNFASCDSDEEDQENETTIEDFAHLELGPQLPLKEQLEKDKEDESLRRWKEQLLGSAILHVGDGFNSNPEVKVSTLGIRAKGREELDLPLPLATNARGHAFSLKEASHYQLKFVFTVRNNIVSGLTCINTVWKCSVMVEEMRSMFGTFAPQQEPYVHITAEQLTPSGTLARGPYNARTRFIDDDGTVYLDLNYSFEIRKDW